MAPDTDKLKEFEEKLHKARAKEQAKIAAPKGDEHYTMANMAWRMVIELVAGLVIGFGIGYGLDWLFGTLPLFLIIFIGLGFVAGVRTMMRSAQEVQEMQERANMPTKDDKEG